MRHHNKNKKFGREKKVRTGLMKALAVSVIAHGKIKTTLAKAKALRPKVEKMVTHAKAGTPAKQRILSGALPTSSVGKLVKEWAPKYKDRQGGYMRIVRAGLRRSDGAPMAFIEFV